LFPDKLENSILDQPIPPIQTQRFGLALLDSIYQGFCAKIEVFSVASLLDFPISKFLIAPMAKWKIFDSIPSTMIPFINLFGLKHLTRFIGTFVFVSLWSLRNFKKDRLIIMHGVQSCKIWGVVFGQFIAPAITISYITDNLGLSLDGEGAIKQNVRLVDVRLMKAGLQRISGIITMTPYPAENLAPGKPSLIINSILNASVFETVSQTSERDDVFTIAYAGGLYHDYGIELLLQAFALTDHPDWRLVIAGSGDLEDCVKEAAKQDSRIEYLGFLNTTDMANLYHTVDVLVNPRLLSSEIAQMAFPSKIVEYLATGKPVVSTDLPTFDEDFRNHLVIARSDTPEELARCFKDVATWEADIREQWQINTKIFLEENLSPGIQGAKIHRFVQSLMTVNIENN